MAVKKSAKLINSRRPAMARPPMLYRRTTGSSGLFPPRCRHPCHSRRDGVHGNVGECSAIGVAITVQDQVSALFGAHLAFEWMYATTGAVTKQEAALHCRR
mmetsp:Transcript_33100/g.60047  ORF Transcript_33100/g.60047 Transcript_33100/m.60047 type:complete len:101 (+) Transcript_33100:15-317(+)